VQLATLEGVDPHTAERMLPCGTGRRADRHLSENVRMGTICVYAPASRVDWDVSVGAS